MPPAHGHKLCFLVAIRHVQLSKMRKTIFFPLSLFSKYCGNQMQFTPLQYQTQHFGMFPQGFLTTTTIWFQNICITLKANPVPTSTHSPVPFPQQARQQPVLFPKNSLFWLCMSCEWNHRKSDLSRLASFFWPNVPRVPSCIVCQHFVPFYAWITVHCVAASRHCVDPVMPGHLLWCLIWYSYEWCWVFVYKHV